MSIFSAILSLIGCNRTNSSASASNEAFDRQLEESIRAFENRPIHKILTTAIIDSTSDNDLLQVIFDNLVEKLDADYTKEYEIVLSWNEARRSIYLIWLLQAEVNNGGHNQFYYNSSGQFYEYLPNALRLVGAQRHAELMERANAIYEREYNRITEHLDGTIEGFSKSYDDNPLNPLDDEFYKLEGEEDLFALQVAYIRAHKEAFADTST